MMINICLDLESHNEPIAKFPSHKSTNKFLNFKPCQRLKYARFYGQKVKLSINKL